MYVYNIWIFHCKVLSRWSMIHKHHIICNGSIKGFLCFAEWSGLILQDSQGPLRVSHLMVRKVIMISLSPQALWFVTLSVLFCSQHSSLQSKFPLHRHTIPCSSFVLRLLSVVCEQHGTNVSTQAQRIIFLLLLLYVQFYRKSVNVLLH